jgi:hypothetical protein
MPKAETVQCDKCASIMIEVYRVTKLADLPDDARPCQQARYFAVIETGEFCEWSMTVVTYVCQTCGHKKVIELH